LLSVLNTYESRVTIFRIFLGIDIELATLSSCRMEKWSTYFVLPLEIWRISSFQVPGTTPRFIKNH
jgi:hypothetical protein